MTGRIFAGIALGLALVACGSKPEATNVDALDAELTQANITPAADPALREALRDQIMVDPALTQQANADAIRPPTQPRSGGVPAIAMKPGAAETEVLRSAPAVSPTCRQCAAARTALTLGALAQSQGGRSGQCAPNVSYSAAWANRLPRGVPLYPDARVAEAAGADRAGCALRVVSFASGASPQRLIDWYYTKTSAAGFSAEHGAHGGEHTLAGTKPGAAFLVVLKPRADGGTDVDLMADGE